MNVDARSGETASEVIGQPAQGARHDGRIGHARQAQLDLTAGLEPEVRRRGGHSRSPADSLDRYGSAGRGVGDEVLLLHSP